MWSGQSFMFPFFVSHSLECNFPLVACQLLSNREVDIPLSLTERVSVSSFYKKCKLITKRDFSWTFKLVSLNWVYCVKSRGTKCIIWHLWKQMNNTENPNLQNRQTEINKTENIFRETHQVLKERCLFALSSLTGWLQYHSTIKSMKISFLFLWDHQQLVVFLLLIYLEVLWSIRHTSVWKDTIVGSNFFQLV